MLSTITPYEAQALIRDGKARLVDIREPEEMIAARIPGAMPAPLSILQWMDLGASEKITIFSCHSGRRTSDNAALLEEKAPGARQLEGGVANWMQQGLPLEQKATGFPVMRQVQIIAGSLILAGVGLSLIWPSALWLSALVGAGLLVAGATGSCAMASLLSTMPWNRSRQ